MQNVAMHENRGSEDIIEEKLKWFQLQHIEGLWVYYHKEENKLFSTLKKSKKNNVMIEYKGVFGWWEKKVRKKVMGQNMATMHGKALKSVIVGFMSFMAWEEGMEYYRL